MIVLGIETSCDETAAAIVVDGAQVRSNVIASQFDLHAEYGGVVPEIASRAHAERIRAVIRSALNSANVTLRDVDLVAVGHRPGLIGSLLVGVAAAKSLAWALGRPLVGVDHLHAHLYAAAMTAPDPLAAYPALGLVVSGGHTSLFWCTSPTSLVRLGSTRDDAIGEAFDKVASMLDLPQPGGPAIDRLAHAPDANDRAFDFPIARLEHDSLDFSFSGLKTAVLYAVRGTPRRDVPGGFAREAPAMLDDARKRNLAASFQRAAVHAIVIKLRRAIDAVGEPPRSLLVGGGVSANSRLRRELMEFARTEGLSLHLPPVDMCVDNAAMIAALGARVLVDRGPDDLTLTASPSATSDAESV